MPASATSFDRLRKHWRQCGVSGVSKTILMRLVVGLVGCGAIAAVFPFMPEPSLRCDYCHSHGPWASSVTVKTGKAAAHSSLVRLRINVHGVHRGPRLMVRQYWHFSTYSSIAATKLHEAVVLVTSFPLTCTLAGHS